MHDAHTDAHADHNVDADVTDADGAGDDSDIKGGHWWDPCTFNHHHGNLGVSHLSIQKLCITCGMLLHLFHNLSMTPIPILLKNFVWFHITCQQEICINNN